MMPTPALPPRVVSNELITSAWGNTVVDVLEKTDEIRGGPTPGGTINPGAQLEVAGIDLPAGSWAVFWQGLVSSGASFNIAARLFFGGSFYTDAAFMCSTQGGSAAATCHVSGYVFAPGGTRASVNVINNGSAAVTVYADVANHRLFAMQGRQP
jgi:hypothetical protein